MLQRFWGRLCPHCLRDETPIERHPAIAALDRTGHRLDRLLDRMRIDEDGTGASGHAARDMISGSYGRGDDRQ